MNQRFKHQTLDDLRLHDHETYIRCHASALSLAGYTVLQRQIGPEELSLLREINHNAAADQREAYAQGLDPDELSYARLEPHFKPSPPRPEGWWRTTTGATGLQFWGKPVLDLLDLPDLNDLLDHLLPDRQLMDVTGNNGFNENRWGWHRDHFTTLQRDETETRYLWCFVLLDDFTAENGATWVVPGTHRMRSGDWLYWDETFDSSTDVYPSRIQVLAKAGDIVVVNSNTLHSAGRRYTDAPRRTCNIRIAARSAESHRPYFNHLAQLEDEQREALSPRVQRLLDSPYAKPGRFPIARTRFPGGDWFCGRRSTTIAG